MKELDNIRLRFVSGNSIPVERAWITREEFTAIAAAPVAQEVSDDLVHHMVRRFLSWRLPKPWNPDNGISYARPNYAHPPADHDWPVGTNLFDAAEAEAMVLYMLEGFGTPQQASIATKPAGASGIADDATERFIADVRAELIRERTKFPGDRIMTIALAEEFGELAKAVLDEPSANVRKEAIQTAVMAARVAIDGDSSVNEWRAAKGLDALTAASSDTPAQGTEK